MSNFIRKCFSSLFCLKVFLIVKHAPLVRQLAEIIFQGDITPPPQENVENDSPRMVSKAVCKVGFFMQTNLCNNKTINIL